MYVETAGESVSDRTMEIQSKHWRRQLWGTGARALTPSTSNGLIFMVTSEPHKLWHKTLCGCLSSKNIQAYSFVTVFVWIS